MIFGPNGISPLNNVDVEVKDQPNMSALFA